MSRTTTCLIISALVIGLLAASASALSVFPPPAGPITKADPSKVTKAEKGKSVWLDPALIPDNSRIGSIPKDPNVGIWPPAGNPPSPPGNPPPSPPGNPGKGIQGGNKGHDHDHDLLTGALIVGGLDLLGQLLSSGNANPQQGFRDPGLAQGSTLTDQEIIELRQRARETIARIDEVERALSDVRTLQRFFDKAILIAGTTGAEARIARDQLLELYDLHLIGKNVSPSDRSLMVAELDRMTRDVDHARRRATEAREREVDLTIERAALERELAALLAAI